MKQDFSMSQYQSMTKELFKTSKTLHRIVQDQFELLADLNAENMFAIDQKQHTLHIANGLFTLKFNVPTEPLTPIFQSDFCHFNKKAEWLEEFILHDLYFLTHDLKPQHSLLLRQKAQQFRELLCAQAYAWVDADLQIMDFLAQLSFNEAAQIDQLMMESDVYCTRVLTDYVRDQTVLSESCVQILQKMCSIAIRSEDDFLPIQALMQSLDNICFRAAEFLPDAVYRIVSLSFEQRFNLNALIEHQQDIYLLSHHAQEKPHLLGFVRLMRRELWQRDDLLSKQNFLQTKEHIWQKKVAKLPLFDYARTVNWLFKQSSDVLDWLSSQVQHSGVRVAITALSFIDSSHVHPQIILATLQYFQHAAAQIFIHCCHDFALQHAWFDSDKNPSIILKGQKQSLNDHRIAISASILYVDEWMQLMRTMVETDDQMAKHIYLTLSRLMQAYMLHLHKTTQALNNELMDYIRPETHQNRAFYLVLKRYKMQIDEFRQLFYLRDQHIRISVFDSYVCDYLLEYIADHKMVAKNLTWMGLFHHAIDWHDHIQKQEIMDQLKHSHALTLTQPILSERNIHFLDWTFEELSDIDRIIQEAKQCQNCLATSYAQRIIEREYVAFHMASKTGKHQMTLGCYIREGELIYDQLEYAQNKKTEYLFVNIALQFISWLNVEYAPFR